MKRFKFRFQAVEKVRKTREDEQLRLLGVAQRAHSQAVFRKNSLLAELEGALERREKLGSEAVPVSAFMIENDFIVGTKQRVIQADQAILRATRGVEKALRAYLAARKQTRMIEILREKEFAEYKKEMGKRADRELNELYVMRQRLDRPLDREGDVA